MKRLRPRGLLLTPGAGADRDQATLVALDRAATAVGVTVSRIDLPKSRVPAKLVQAVRDQAAALPAPLVIGGRSMGGRMCSFAAAEGLAVAGLLLISYPLHPPGRPEKTEERTAHFPKLEVPCLFISGTRDAFGTPEELEKATASIPGPVTHRWVEGRDHGLRGVDDLIAEETLSWLGA